MSSMPKKRRQLNDNGGESQSMDVDQGRELKKKHQLLLQYLTHARLVKKKDLLQVHEKLFSDDEFLKDSISTLTNHINPLKMDIKQVKCDVTGETYFVIIHTTGELFFPRCCIFSKHQLDFLKQVLTLIVLSPDGKIGKIEALNACSQPMSKTEADECLVLFLKERLIMEINENGQFCLTPLAIVEFTPFFTACLPESLSTCGLCKQLVFVGKVCNRPNCGMKFHFHCFLKWVKKRLSCPNCYETWSCGNMSVDTE